MTKTPLPGSTGDVPESDFASHHIQGFARAALETGKDGTFHVPLITEILPRLYMGGCKNGARLPNGFTFVLSLYTGERYSLPADCTRAEVRMRDSDTVPDSEQLAGLASRVLTAWEAGGQVLVHCQAGLNRSGLVMALVLMRHGLPAAEAIGLLRKRRHPVVLCNQHFEAWLLALQPVDGRVIA